jgi:hypothetical protein
MHALLPTLIIGELRTAAGTKQVALTAGVSDNVYAIDVDKREILWRKRFEYPPPARNGGPTDPLCPGGLTATPVIGPADASGTRTAYVLAGDGSRNLVTSAASLAGITVSNGRLYSSTLDGTFHAFGIYMEQ